MSEATIGHNSEGVTQFSRDQLKAVIERVERLEEEKKTISEDIRDNLRRGQGQRLRRESSAYDRADAEDGP